MTTTTTTMNDTTMNDTTNVDWIASAAAFVGLDALRRAVAEYDEYTDTELRHAYMDETANAATVRCQVAAGTPLSLARSYEQRAAKVSHVQFARQIMRDARKYQ